jgi:hypothetical protein
VRFKARGLDHQPIPLGALAGQFGEDPVEHTEPAPADEEVVDGLVWTIRLRRVAPAQPATDHEDNPRDHPPNIELPDTMRHRKIGFDSAHLRQDSQNISLIAPSPLATNESTLLPTASNLMSPEPRSQKPDGTVRPQTEDWNGAGLRHESPRSCNFGGLCSLRV